MYQDELYHFGVKGMKWGVRKRRDNYYSERANKYAKKSIAYSTLAERSAKNKHNGSNQLVKAERYMKRSVKSANKVSSNSKKNEINTQMKKSYERAAKNYIQRSNKERVKSFVTNAAVSTGVSFVALYAGMPYGMLYLDPGPKYNLKMSDFGYSDELYHKFWEKKDHKYIAKEKVKKKWRYFYTKAAYDAFKEGQKITNAIASKLGLNKKTVKKGENFVNKVKTKPINGFALFYTKNDLQKAVGFVANALNKLSSSIFKPKYIAKVKLPNGKYRYFYDQDEYDAYKKRLEYQKNEPDFMKNIPKIDPNKVYTKDEDMAEINEDYDYNDLKSSMNCYYCTTAYELRRRGYDVEASDYNLYTYRGDLQYFDDMYKNPDINYIAANGKTYQVASTGDAYTDKNPPAKSDKVLYTASNIEKGILDNNPPGSRGNLCVFWKGGGGHSIVYEVTKDNKVEFRDTQRNVKMSAKELENKITDMFVVRTDNLELKEGVLETAYEN